MDRIYETDQEYTECGNSHTLVIEGRNSVIEAFRSGRTIDKVFVLDGCQDGPVRTIVREAKKHGALLSFVSKDRLNQLSQTGKHQGVIAYAAAYDYSEVDDMLALAEERGEAPFLLLLDGIEDPHNLGAIIRQYRGSPRGDHPEETGGRTYRNGRKDIGRRVKLYAGGESDESCEDDRRVKRKRHVVRMCGYGRGSYV